MAFITPLPRRKRGNTGILNIMEKLSKMMRSIPIPEKSDAVKIACLFKDHVYRNHGLPHKIISDRHTILMSKFWTTLFKLLGTQIAPSTAYHPQTDGQSETVNRKTEEMNTSISQFQENNWDEQLVYLKLLVTQPSTVLHCVHRSISTTELFQKQFLLRYSHQRTPQSSSF